MATTPDDERVTTGLGICIDGHRMMVVDDDDCEDVQMVLIAKAQRAAERGDTDKQARYLYRAHEIGVLYDALRAGAMIAQPEMEI